MQDSKKHNRDCSFSRKFPLSAGGNVIKLQRVSWYLRIGEKNEGSANDETNQTELYSCRYVRDDAN